MREFVTIKAHRTDWRRASGYLLALSILVLLTAPSLSRARELSIGVAAPQTSFDPHYHVDAASWALHRHVFEPLIHLTPDGRLMPGLARHWTPLAAGDGWEVQIDRDAFFQDGTPVTAAAVEATLARLATVPNSPGRFTSYVSDLLRTEVVDAHTLRLHTRGAAPLLPNGLATIFVVPEAIARTATTADFNAGTAAVGSGPYRLVRYRQGIGAEFERNDAWWQARRDPTRLQPWSSVRVRVIPNDAARVAALLAGDVDLIDAVPPRDRSGLAARPNLRLAQAPGMRLMYIALDQGERPRPGLEGSNGQPLTRNPLSDVRVRRALSLAIDRAALVSQIMEGQGIPAAQIMLGHSEAADPQLLPTTLNRAEARRLLAEAGWSNGFRVTLTSTGDRFLNDERIVQAVAQMWSQVGIETRVDVLPATVFMPRFTSGAFGAALFGWLGGALEPNGFFMNVVATRDASRGRGGYNALNYSNQQVDTLIDLAMATVDPARRQAAWRQAAWIALGEDMVVLPLFHQLNVWATRGGFTYEARSDAMTLATGVRLAPSR